MEWNEEQLFNMRVKLKSNISTAFESDFMRNIYM